MSLIIKITMSKSTIDNTHNVENPEEDKSISDFATNGNCNKTEAEESQSDENNGNIEIAESKASTSTGQNEQHKHENNLKKSNSNSKLSLIVKRNRECKTHSNGSKTNLENVPSPAASAKKKGHNWVLKFNCAKLKPKSNTKSSRVMNNDTCVCTGYRKVEDTNLNSTKMLPKKSSSEENVSCSIQPSSTKTSSNISVYTTEPQQNQLGFNPTQEASAQRSADESLRSSSECLRNIELSGPIFRRPLPFVFFSIPPLIDLAKFNPDDYPTEDIEERARYQRALEIAEGIDPPPGFRPNNSTSTSSSTSSTPSTESPIPPMSPQWSLEARQWQLLCPTDINVVDSLKAIITQHFPVPNDTPRVHTQVDYIHCLVPDLKQITACGFYWGKMDRYEAETLLEGKPEGTFLLRDSAQEEYLFSVSFRKYGRSLHARIEQFNHRFSFDSHDPGVFSSTSVTGLLEHYKDPTCVMFFEPMLTVPLNRSFSFSLQQLCRSVIVSHTSYDGISNLSLPRMLRSYLREYHYRQRVRVKRFDEGQSCLS